MIVKKFLAGTLIFTLLGVPVVSNSSTCETIWGSWERHQFQKKVYDWGIRSIADVYLPNSKLKKEAELEALGIDPAKVPASLLNEKKVEETVATRNDERGTFHTRTLRLVPGNTSKRGRRSKMAAKFSGNDFLADMYNRLEIVFEKYKEARDWDPKFIARLKSDVTSYLSFSEFHFVTEGPPLIGAVDQVQGVIKFITLTGVYHKYQLPVEREMGIKIETPSRLKVEPGNYAIRGKNYDRVIEEVYLQIHKQILRWEKSVPNDEVVFFTYGDRKSKLMYSAFGFKHLKEYPTKQINGKTWYVLGASISDMRNTINAPKNPKLFDFDRIQKINQLAESDIYKYRGWSFGLQGLVSPNTNVIVGNRLSLAYHSSDIFTDPISKVRYVYLLLALKTEKSASKQLSVNYAQKRVDQMYKKWTAGDEDLTTDLLVSFRLPIEALHYRVKNRGKNWDFGDIRQYARQEGRNIQLEKKVGSSSFQLVLKNTSNGMDLIYFKADHEPLNQVIEISAGE